MYLMVNIRKQDINKSHILAQFFINYCRIGRSGQQGFVIQGINCIFALLFNKVARGKGT
ncbi:hypothetical protein SAMN04488116_3066 [Flagellimonas flava]|uniref:Uncharacterized protein n=1 Tax=Flagellimonas flava TaxID=570519 RepID=A0A1M5P4Q2_9FLAO|nr:hypothetical protein SAMN04488116_3066 [Allomuricauda flava]